MSDTQLIADCDRVAKAHAEAIEAMEAAELNGGTFDKGYAAEMRGRLRLIAMTRARSLAGCRAKAAILVIIPNDELAASLAIDVIANVSVIIGS